MQEISPSDMLRYFLIRKEVLPDRWLQGQSNNWDNTEERE